MTKKTVFTQAAVRRNIRAAQQEGLFVVGIQADGTVLVNHADSAFTPVARCSTGRRHRRRPSTPAKRTGKKWPRTP